MTFIILEGCDGSGKTSLANAIRAELEKRYPEDDIEYHHAAQLDEDPFDAYALAFEDYRPGEERHIICDRLHWGETIYGPLYREGSAVTTAGFRWIELYLKARGATSWLVTAPLDTVQKRLGDRGEDYLESHHVEHVWRSFNDVAAHALTTGGVADTSTAGPEELAEKIVADAIWTEDRAATCYRPEYIGKHIPRVLLVGDKQGTADPGVTAAPFMPRGKSSGIFLFEAMQDAWWRDVGIVNAHETDFKELLPDLFDPPIVALGMEASHALSELDIEHSIVPHPQKVRRFHNKLQREYGELLREVTLFGGNKITWPK